MKDQILKIAKVKSEKEFYKKYPTEEAFMKAHGKAFKKAAMGAKMVNDQLHQLTDFGNPPQAQVGTYVGGQADRPFSPVPFNDILSNVHATNTGLSKEELARQNASGKVNPQAAPQKGNDLGLLNEIPGIIKELEDGGEVDSAQWGTGLLGSPIDFATPTAMAIASLFGNKSAGTKTASTKQADNKSADVAAQPSAKYINVVDPRKTMMTTGKPLRPNVDLLGGKYTTELLGPVLTYAKTLGATKEDLENLAAMSFQETKWGYGKTKKNPKGLVDPNIGHTKGNWKGNDQAERFVNAYFEKMKVADRLKITDPIMRLQVYNGTDKLTQDTEKKYHGFKMKKIYGVDIPPEGIDVKKNPLYGKQVTDIKKNVLGQSPEFVRYLDSTYNAPIQKRREMGGEIDKAQNGLDTSGIGQLLGKAFEPKGGVGSGLVDMFGGDSKKIMNVGPKGALMKGAKDPITGIAADAKGFGAGAAAAGMGIVDAAPQILQGIGQIEKQHGEIAKANQFSKVSNLTASAAESKPDVAKRRYVRPEDSLVQPGQSNNPQGVGTNYLSAENGAEIQNTYAPEDIYVGLGYEPLDESNLKQYQSGGRKHLSSERIETSSHGVPGLAIRDIYQNPNMTQDTAYSYDSPTAMLKYETNGGKPYAFVGGRGGFNSSQPDSLAKYKDVLSSPFERITDLKSGERVATATERLARGNYENGGNIPTAEFGEYFQDSGQASIGKGVGSAIGSAFFGPLGGKVGGFLGGVAGNLLGGVDDARKLQHFQDLGKQNTERAAWAQGSQAIHAQNANVMKDGGYTDDDHAWVSNGWQPQVITQFGGHSMKDLLQPPHDADMLRAGGHLQSYTPPSAEAMYTGRDQYAMGGEIKTTWGGKAETMSYNPYLPGTGETVMFKGQSHDETDGKGRSGIGVKYGNGGMTDYAQNGGNEPDADVEVERNEPAAELVDPQTGEKNLVVYGNMKIPDYGVKEIGDKKAKGKKFKHYAADLSKQEAKHNKTIEKATELVNNSNGNDPFDQLSLNAGKAMIMGANAKLKNIAEKKKIAATVQNAILDTAEEFGVESDGLAKGKLRPIKDPSIGRDGKKLKKAQNGLPLLGQLQGLSDEEILDPKYPERMAALRAYMSGNKKVPYQNAVMSGTPTFSPFEVPTLGRRPLRTKIPYDPKAVQEIVKMDRPKIPTVPASAIDQSKLAKHLADLQALKPAKGTGKERDEKTGWQGLADTVLSAYPFFRPTNQMPLDPGQLMGEMYALGNNQEEGVKAQTFQPMLDQPYDISLQDQLNAIDSQSRAAILAAGQDPAAQSYIMAQAADAKNKVLGEQFRMNQVNKAQVYQANRQALNQAQLQNLGILDTQYVRQETGKSKTKAQTIEALNSISDKIAKSKLENRTVGVMENMYNYRFDPQGRAYNINSPYQFAIPQLGIADPSLTDNGLKDGTVPVYDNKGNIMAYKVVQPTKTAAKKRNGSIVKAIKNL